MKAKPYKLREYSSEDFKDPKKFVQGKQCFVCGHHLPCDQFIVISGTYAHSSVKICVALLKEKGRK